jgi:hypothetical protein
MFFVALVACAAAPSSKSPPPAPACAIASPTCSASTPSWRASIAPVVERRCGHCHAGDGVAAEEHDFSRFDVAHAQARRIVDQLSSCTMPPRTALSPTPEEAAAIVAWAACGAPP